VSPVDDIQVLESTNARLRRSLEKPRWPIWTRITIAFMLVLLSLVTALSGLAGYALATFVHGFTIGGGAPDGPIPRGKCADPEPRATPAVERAAGG
jgi:hypothetical protein